MSKIRHLIISTTSLFMIGILSLWIVNRALFIHTHKFADGQSVTHAHPFQKSGNNATSPGHGHSNAEFLFFDGLDLLFSTLFLTPLLLRFPVSFEYKIAYRFSGTNALPTNKRRRAPPCLA